MSLRDDVRWVCDTADGLLVGWLPSRLPPWSTKEGEKLGWLVLLLWRKFYDAAVARSALEAEVVRLKDDVDGLRETNERLTELLDQPRRKAVVAALGTSPVLQPGYYWLRFHQQEPEVAYWDGASWWFCETRVGVIRRVPFISGQIHPPGVPDG